MSTSTITFTLVSNKPAETVAQIHINGKSAGFITVLPSEARLFYRVMEMGAHALDEPVEVSCDHGTATT